MAKKRSIVIVDDEPDILEFLSYNLRSEGYEVKTFLDGNKALPFIEKTRPDLVVLDIMMPEIDGVELCKKIRSRKRTKDILVAFLTAKGDDLTQISALESGGDDYIQKPIKPKVFLSRIKAILRRKKGKSDEKENIHLRDLEIIKSKMKVVVKGKKIDLVKKEFQLLYLLASDPDRIFERQEILDRVWGSDVIVGDRTIDVHIRKLREKMGSGYIKTVKGVGYKVEF